MRRVGFAGVVLATLLLAPSAVRAQGSGSTGGGSAGGSPGFQNFDTSRSIEGRIVEIDSREGYLILAHRDKNYKVEVDESVKLKADKKTGLHKNELTLGDFAVGYKVKLTVRTSDGRLMELRLRDTSPSG